ncbi:hypothetical protein ACNAN0_08170 [Agrilactobacillus fermenti]|uniref:hypothetical protein n=1 Tax=Agrilactobacillus fermenti TaxID=2586909 RepID=UPI003A5BBB43
MPKQYLKLDQDDQPYYDQLITAEIYPEAQFYSFAKNDSEIEYTNQHYRAQTKDHKISSEDIPLFMGWLFHSVVQNFLDVQQTDFNLAMFDNDFEMYQHWLGLAKNFPAFYQFFFTQATDFFTDIVFIDDQGQQSHLYQEVAD